MWCEKMLIYMIWPANIFLWTLAFIQTFSNQSKDLKKTEYAEISGTFRLDLEITSQKTSDIIKWNEKKILSGHRTRKYGANKHLWRHCITKWRMMTLKKNKPLIMNPIAKISKISDIFPRQPNTMPGRD